MGARNNSEGKPYFTQRNNRIKPGESCNVTSIINALSAAGWPVENMAEKEQVEDELHRFILTDVMVDKFWRRIDPNGAIPPNEWHEVLAFGTNRWIAKRGFSACVFFKEGVGFDRVINTINDGGSLVMSGRFGIANGGKIDHMVAVVGYDGDSLIIDDPWGDYRDGYTTIKGDNVLLARADFDKIFKPLDKVKKWGHIVSPYKEA